MERRGIANRPTEWRSAADSVGAAVIKIGGKSSCSLSPRSTHETETPLELFEVSMCPFCVALLVAGQREAIGFCRSYFVAMHAVADRRVCVSEPAVLLSTHEASGNCHSNVSHR